MEAQEVAHLERAIATHIASTYGRTEAIVKARHPHRFTPAGTARWRGHIYDSFAPRLLRQRVYRGVYGTAALPVCLPRSQRLGASSLGSSACRPPSR